MACLLLRIGLLGKSKPAELLGEIKMASKRSFLLIGLTTILTQITFSASLAAPVEGVCKCQEPPSGEVRIQFTEGFSEGSVCFSKMPMACTTMVCEGDMPIWSCRMKDDHHRRNEFPKNKPVYFGHKITEKDGEIIIDESPQWWNLPYQITVSPLEPVGPPKSTIPPEVSSQIQDSYEFINEIFLRTSAGATLGYLFYSSLSKATLATKVVRICSLPFLVLSFTGTVSAADVAPYEGMEDYFFETDPTHADREFWNETGARETFELKDALAHLMNLQGHYPDWNPKGYVMTEMVIRRLGDSSKEQEELKKIFDANEAAGRHEEIRKILTEVRENSLDCPSE